MSFEVTILGCGAAVPTSRRNPTSQYVVCNDRHILIDCGEGTQIQIRKYGVKFQRINHILISHMHGDHYFGLVGLISTMHLMGRDKGLTIYGPVELENIIRLQLELGGSKLDFDITFVPLNGRESKLLFEDRLIEIHTFPLKHRIPTNGFIIKEKTKERRLISEAIKGSGLTLQDLPKLKNGENVISDSGRVYEFEDYTLPPNPSFSYAYCSDTVYDEGLISTLENATVLYHEATFIEKDRDRARSTFHSTAIDAANLAKLSKIKTLLLGHLSARYESDDQHYLEANEIFENVLVVEDGQKIIIQ